MTSQQENLSEKIILSENNKKFIEYWENTKLKGFLKYILLEGTIWGILVGLFTLFIVEDFTNWEKSLRYILIYIGGGIIGLAPSMWFFHNWRYKVFKKRFPNEN